MGGDGRGGCVMETPAGMVAFSATVTFAFTLTLTVRFAPGHETLESSCIVSLKRNAISAIAAAPPAAAPSGSILRTTDSAHSSATVFSLGCRRPRRLRCCTMRNPANETDPSFRRPWGGGGLGGGAFAADPDAM